MNPALLEKRERRQRERRHPEARSDESERRQHADGVLLCDEGHAPQTGGDQQKAVRPEASLIPVWSGFTSRTLHRCSLTPSEVRVPRIGGETPPLPQ